MTDLATHSKLYGVARAWTERAVNTEELTFRKSITFEQAEGAEELPAQLKPREVSQEFRAIIWAYIHSQITIFSDNNIMGEKLYVGGDWQDILFDHHVYRQYLPADEFDSKWETQKSLVKNIIYKGDYLKVMGFLQWVMRHEKASYRLEENFATIFENTRMPYRIIEATIVPIGNDEQGIAIKKAFEATRENKSLGSYQHLKKAAEYCTTGDFAGSVRESVHAVESIAKILSPGAQTLSPAIAELEKRIRVHPSMRRGFEALYGFSSDEKGIRHALLDKGTPNVDEADALFMLGACSSFISYLWHKFRTAENIGASTR